MLLLHMQVVSILRTEELILTKTACLTSGDHHHSGSFKVACAALPYEGICHADMSSSLGQACQSQQ